MNADSPGGYEGDERPSDPTPASRAGLLRRHPKLAILLIAGVFYAILAGLVLFVFVLLIRN